MLYLHRYGGLYSDLDYEAHGNIFDDIFNGIKNNTSFIVESQANYGENVKKVQVT